MLNDLLDNLPDSVIYPLDIASGWVLEHLPVVCIAVAVLLLLVVLGAFDD